MKKRVLFMLIFVVIFFLSFFFVRKIPDYSRDYGYRYVFLNDYEKNKAGICLLTDTKIPTKELIERGVFDFLRKEKTLSELMLGFRCNVSGKESCSDQTYKREIGFYSSKEIGLRELINSINSIDFKKNPDEQVINLFERLGFSHDFSSSDFVFNESNMTAGFNVSVLSYIGRKMHILLSNQSFIIELDDGKPSFGLNYIYFDGKRKISDWEYSQYYRNIKYHRMNGKNKIDNCGFSNFNLNNSLEKAKETTINAG